MNCAVCFVSRELEQARRWFDWCAELGGVSAHSLFVMPFRGISFDPATVKGWKSVTLVQDWMGIESDWSSTNAQRGAEGPNASYRQLCRHFADNNLGPFLFCEVDCIPLVPDWLDRLEAEYRRAGRKHMGNIVRVDGIPEHLTGNAVYAGDTAHVAVNLMLPRYATIEGKNLEVAFDVSGAPDILPNAHITNLIQHRFRAAPITTREEFETLVDKNAVLYHSDKTGSTIPFIREKLSGRTGTQREPAAAVSLFPAHATPTGKPKVFTYYGPAPTPELITEQTRLLQLWEKLWGQAGFEPLILTEHDAKRHPKFDEWSKALLAKPTVNPAEFERASWIRHIAIAAVGGGLLLDYDCFPNGFSVTNFSNICAV